MYCRAGGHILEMFPLSVKFEMVFENLLAKESYRNARELLMVLSNYINQGRQGKMSCCRHLFILKSTLVILNTSLPALLLWRRKFPKYAEAAFGERNKIIVFSFFWDQEGEGKWFPCI